MSNGKLLLGLALGLCLASGDLHGAEAGEAQWIAAAGRVVAFGQAEGLPVVLHVERGPGLPGHTPIGLWTENGRCRLVVSARDNPSARRLTELVDPAYLELFLEGAAVHELGHCHRRLNGYPANEKLLPIAKSIGFIRDWFNRRVRTEEAFADMTEVAWLARYHPESFEAMIGQITRVRTRFLEPKHDTLPWLAAALADGPADAGGDLFALAAVRLNRHR
ncbi:hypothetical protein [Massilia glaciei]|uniref:Uncharacterized protein n=1 Tax=Massilia glaciei TaxID=1524097 RepID=A0A2U2HPI0_9BURK|nr:hypothetical protein [Massilia glaciei]PWF49411.1 hypothetical protein C7C56_006670 [Massilia glaciei]